MKKNLKNGNGFCWLFLILGIIRIILDEMKSKDGIYYLTVKNESTKTASLDKTSWIKIEGEQIAVKEGS